MKFSFDSVDYQILFCKIQSVGASTSALKRFNSYLTNRYQVVRIHSFVSYSFAAECGVPQGSILGPLLFSIYVNGLPEILRHCSTECYVDDKKLLVSFNLHDSQRIVQEMNEDLLQVRNWCFGDRLLLNQDKSKLIALGSRQMISKLPEFHFSLLGKDISPLQSARDLGVTLDSNLTFDNHITTMVSECIARLAQINRFKHCLDKNTLLTVIHALVFSKMYYCSNVWANITNKNVRKLQAVQNFASELSAVRKNMIV